MKKGVRGRGNRREKRMTKRRDEVSKVVTTASVNAEK